MVSKPCLKDVWIMCGGSIESGQVIIGQLRMSLVRTGKISKGKVRLGLGRTG